MRATDRYVAQNRRARHDYLIEDTIEAGLVLHGTEVKVLRKGQASIVEAYADESGGELFLVNANIPEYAASAHFNHEPRRPRKLLLHRKEVNRLLGAIRREGVTVVPLSIYFNERGRAKIALGLARGKRKADKRESEKNRDWQRSRARISARAERLTRRLTSTPAVTSTSLGTNWPPRIAIPKLGSSARAEAVAVSRIRPAQQMCR